MLSFWKVNDHGTYVYNYVVGAHFLKTLISQSFSSTREKVFCVLFPVQEQALISAVNVYRRGVHLDTSASICKFFFFFLKAR